MILFMIILTLSPLGLTSNVSDSSRPIEYIDKSKSDLICANKTCVNRCCSQGEYLKCEYDTNFILLFCHCETSNSSMDTHDHMFSNVQLYSNKIYGEKVDTKFATAFVLVPSFYLNASDEFKATTPLFEADPNLRVYLGMDGKLQMESPNAYNRWDVYDTDKFCVDIVDDKFVDYVLYNTPQIINTKTFVSSMFVSSFFLILVLVVYAVLPNLRNLPGKILMAYVISLLIAFISFSIIELFEIIGLPSNSCIILSSIIYGSFLSSFCWMNVMSYDIFWTFRSYAKARVHRNGENFKFAMYCLYAWGVPLALTAMMLMMEYADFSDKPWIIKPLISDRGTFLVEGQELVYLYMPMLILIICNWVFFLLTVFNIWRVSRATAVVRSPASGNAAAHRAHKLRFTLYIKLSVIMGVNWLLEVVSSFYPEFSGCLVFDIYNCLVGFFIFIIFICKRKIYKDLQAKFSSIRLDQWSTITSANNSTYESNLSQDQVSKHPRHFDGL